MALKNLFSSYYFYGVITRKICILVLIVNICQEESRKRMKIWKMRTFLVTSPLMRRMEGEVLFKNFIPYPGAILGENKRTTRNERNKMSSPSPPVLLKYYPRFRLNNLRID